MTRNKAKLVLAFIAFVLFFSILALVYWDFIRDTIIVPIYYIIWVIGLFLRSIPQGVYFAFLITLSLVMGFKTLEGMKDTQNPKRRKGDQPQAGTQYLHWKSLYTSIDVNPFARNRFAWEARKLILSILAYEQGVNTSEAEALVRNGMVDIPDTIRNLIEEKRIPDTRLTLNRITSLMLRVRRLFFNGDTETDLEIDSSVAEIIGFIEYHLEINHAGNELIS
jgi:hypothetical protein